MPVTVRPPRPALTPFTAPINAGSADNNVPALAGSSGTIVEGLFMPGDGTGVYGVGSPGVFGSGSPAGRFESGNGYCVEAVGTADVDAINATTSSPHHAALAGHNNGGGFGLWSASDQSGGIGLYARGKKYAAQLDGDLQVNGQASFSGVVTFSDVVTAKVDIVLGSDCAEDFDNAAAEEIEPGTVMVLNEDGALQASHRAYDKKVAGVISGAGDYQPGLILGRDHVSRDRLPLGLVGKVFCKVDARYGQIEVGDLLTTSPTAGHAMRAADPAKAFGAVIGKALRSLSSGQALVPILIALQ